VCCGFVLFGGFVACVSVVVCELVGGGGGPWGGGELFVIVRVGHCVESSAICCLMSCSS